MKLSRPLVAAPDTDCYSSFSCSLLIRSELFHNAYLQYMKWNLYTISIMRLQIVSGPFLYFLDLRDLDCVLLRLPLRPEY